MKSYLNELKAAVINQDVKKLKEILDKKPNFKNFEEAKEIQVYFNEAINFLNEKREKLLKDMQKIKKIKNYTS